MNYEEWLEWREEYFKEGVNLLNEEEDCKITGEIIMANKENRKQETKKVETTPPVVKQPKVETPVMETPNPKKDIWEVKDRIY